MTEREVWREIIQRVRNGNAAEDDWVLIREGAAKGHLVVVDGPRAVRIGGSADGATILTGNGNLLAHISGASAEAIRAALAELCPPSLHQIPLPPADFTGRNRDFDHLLSRLRRGVTISGIRGMGGIGKTALALKLAHAVEAQYPDAQLFLDLKGTSLAPLTTSQALGRVIHAFLPTALLPEDQSELEGLYRSVLHGKHVILLMDNAGSAEQVTPLLPPEGSVLLITSRRRFTLAGLVERDLGALEPEQAEELLLKICPRIGAEAKGVARLCSGLPLALRLVGQALAVRRDLNAAEYAQRLADPEQRLAQLGEVETALSASYDLLPLVAQERWRRLAVFPGRFDWAAAGAVWKLEGETVLDQLGELLTYSLVEWEEEVERYRLHDLARDFAEAKLENEERRAIQHRHAEHYLRVAMSCEILYVCGAMGVTQAGLSDREPKWGAMGEGLGLYDLERENIEAGQAFAAANAEGEREAAQLCVEYSSAAVRVFSLRQTPRERIRWSQAALIAARRLHDRADHAIALGNLGSVYFAVGQPRHAIELHQQHLAVAREIGDRHGEGCALGNLGNVYVVLGETRRAIELHEQSLAIAREVGDRRMEASALGNLGVSYVNLGEARRAIELHERSLAIAREYRDCDGEGRALCNLANAYAALGDPHRAIELHERSLTIARESGDRDGEGRALGNLANAYGALGDPHRAIELHEQYLAIAREIGDRQGEVNALGNLGLASALGDPRRAIEFFEQSLVIAREIGDRQGEGNALGNLGNVYAILGEPRHASQLYEQHLAIAREMGDRGGEGRALSNLGNAYDVLGEPRRAVEFYEQRLAIAREMGDRDGEGGALGRLGSAYLAMGEPRRAIEFYEQRRAIARQICDRSGEASALGNLANAYANLGEARRAIELHEQCFVIVREIGDRQNEGRVLFNLGLSFDGLGERVQAIARMREALRIFEQIESPHTAQARAKLAEWGA